MKFDRIEKSLRDFGKLAERAPHLVPEIARNAGAECLGILRKAPRFYIYDWKNLLSKARDINIPEQEFQQIAENLPYSAFTAVVNNQVFFFCMEQDFTWVVSFIDNADEYDDNERANSFLGPIKILALPTGNEITYPTIAQVNDDDMENLANELYGFGVNILVVLSVYSNNFYMVTTPEKLQVKRAKNGKYPSYEYRIITLDKSAVNLVPIDQRIKITNKLSPRTHTRRGHIRHYASGKTSWIRSAIIALKNQHTRGRITKDYDVKI